MYLVISPIYKELRLNNFLIIRIPIKYIKHVKVIIITTYIYVFHGTPQRRYVYTLNRLTSSVSRILPVYAKREPTYERLLYEYQLPGKKDTPPSE